MAAFSWLEPGRDFVRLLAAKPVREVNNIKPHDGGAAAYRRVLLGLTRYGMRRRNFFAIN